MRAVRGVMLAIVVGAFAVGLTSAALATEALSSWFRFFGPTQVGGNTQCSDQQARVNNVSDSAYGYVRARYGATCANPRVVGPGGMATIQYVVRSSNGTICGFRDWYYATGGETELGVPAFWNSSSICPGGVGYHGHTKGRYWDSQRGLYFTSNTWSNSPSLNLF
jgi:hypothetical protein